MTEEKVIDAVSETVKEVIPVAQYKYFWSNEDFEKWQTETNVRIVHFGAAVCEKIEGIFVVYVNETTK